MSAWLLSAILLAGATGADIHSSWDRQERNPLVAGAQGRFGARGVVIKVSVTGGFLALQRLALRKHRRAESVCIWTNAGIAAGLAGASAYNYRTRPKE